MAQICFTGEAGCPQFTPNPFKADICTACQQKIQSHSGAGPAQVAAALEFAVDKEASVVWQQGEGVLLLGGYKAANNVKYVEENGVSLIVNTAKGLEETLGPRYSKQIEERRRKLPDLDVLNLGLRDDLTQKLDEEQLRATVRHIKSNLDRGGSVIVHCAQGKSRSAVIVVCFLCWILHLSVEDSLALLKTKRSMAQPNYNFMEQLFQLERSGLFNSL